MRILPNEVICLIIKFEFKKSGLLTMVSYAVEKLKCCLVETLARITERTSPAKKQQDCTGNCRIEFLQVQVRRRTGLWRTRVPRLAG